LSSHSISPRSASRVKEVFTLKIDNKVSTRPGRVLESQPALPLAAQAWSQAKAGARALSIGVEPMRLLADGLWVADALIVLTAAMLASLLRQGLTPIPLEVYLSAVLAAVLTVNAMQISGAYAGVLNKGFAAQVGKVVRAWSLVFAVLMLLGYVTKTSESYSRLWAGTWYGGALFGFAATRAWSITQTKRWRRQGRLTRTVAVVELGSNGDGMELVRRLQSSSPGEIHLVGLFSEERSSIQRNGIQDLIALAQLFRIDEVLVTVSGQSGANISSAIRRLGTIPTNVRICPWVAELGLPVRDVGFFMQNAVMTIYRRPFTSWNRVVKRAEDIVLGTVMMLLLSPILLLIALFVKLDSSGPALFKQKRLGFNNNVLIVYKFRTMKHRPSLNDAVPQAQRGDPRVTRVGRFLRRSSLDELPQLLNVLKGEMSLVGPRPHAIAHNEQYAVLIDDYLGRHRVQPGITGWAQVNGLRGETDTLDKMQRRVEFDLAYIDRWSILMDLKIIMLTALSLVFDRDVY